MCFQKSYVLFLFQEGLCLICTFCLSLYIPKFKNYLYICKVNVAVLMPVCFCSRLFGEEIEWTRERKSSTKCFVTDVSNASSVRCWVQTCHTSSSTGIKNLNLVYRLISSSHPLYTTFLFQNFEKLLCFVKHFSFSLSVSPLVLFLSLSLCFFACLAVLQLKGRKHFLLLSFVQMVSPLLWCCNIVHRSKFFSPGPIHIGHIQCKAVLLCKHGSRLTLCCIYNIALTNPTSEWVLQPSLEKRRELDARNVGFGLSSSSSKTSSQSELPWQNASVWVRPCHSCQ